MPDFIRISPIVTMLSHQNPVVETHFAVVDRAGIPLENCLLYINAMPETSAKHLSSPRIVTGTLVEGSEWYRIKVRTDADGVVILRWYFDVLPQEFSHIFLMATAEFGSDGWISAMALLHIFPHAQQAVEGAMDSQAVLLKEKSGRDTGIPCPQCGALIEIKIEDLLRRSFFRCKQCGLELTLNRFAQQRVIEEYPMANEEIESVEAERVGAADTALRTSPIARAGEANANWNCYYNGREYSNGALLCMVGELFQCSYGVWIDKNKSCG